MSDPDKEPVQSRLPTLRHDLMRYFAKDTPEMRLRALRWCLLPSILAAGAWIGGVVVAALRYWG